MIPAEDVMILVEGVPRCRFCLTDLDMRSVHACEGLREWAGFETFLLIRQRPDCE